MNVESGGGPDETSAAGADVADATRGDSHGATTVLLSGRSGGTTHREVELLDSLPSELRLIGGLAVMCRVGSPHRTTVDLDVVARDLESLHHELERVALTAPGGGQYRFEGDMDLDVIDVAPVPAVDLARQLVDEDPQLSDLELNVLALTWAHDTATRMNILAVDDLTGEPVAHANDRAVASVAGLIAMKAGSIPLRASTKPEKRASDLYDLSRLLLVRGSGAADFGGVPAVLADAVRERLHRWFVDDAGRDRTFRDIRRFDEPRVDLDDVADAVERLEL